MLKRKLPANRRRRNRQRLARQIETLEPRRVLATNIDLVGMDLVISDPDSANDDIEIVRNVPAAQWEVLNNRPINTGIAGAAGSGGNSVTIPFAAFTGDVIVQLGGGDDMLTIDYGTEIPQAIFVDGDAGDDEVVVRGNIFADLDPTTPDATLTIDAATQGTFTGLTNGLLSFDTTESFTSQLLVEDFLVDYGVDNDARTMRSLGFPLEIQSPTTPDVSLNPPTSSLTLDGTDAVGDSLRINDSHDFTNGDFISVDIENVLHEGSIIGGDFRVEGAERIESSGDAISSGDIVFEANSTGLVGNDEAILISGGNLTTTAGGVSITGIGDDDNVAVGVRLTGGATVRSTASGAGVADLLIDGQGRGDAGDNVGVLIDNASIRSTDALILVQGQGGADGLTLAGSNHGIQITAGVINSGGTGANSRGIQLQGTGGEGPGSVGVLLNQLAGTISVSSRQGEIDIAGTGGFDAVSNLGGNAGVEIRGSFINSDSTSEAIAITGNGSFNFGRGLVVDNSVILGQDGPILLTGIGDGNGGASDATGITVTGSDIQTAAGDVVLSGNGGNEGLSTGVRVSGSDIFSSTGDMVVSGVTQSATQPGLLLEAGANIGAATTRDIQLTADEMDFELAAIQGAGVLTINPIVVPTSIGIGGGSGTLNISDMEIAAIAPGFALIDIGDVDSGTVRVDAAAFTSSVRLTGRTVLVEELTSTNDVSLRSITGSILGFSSTPDVIGVNVVLDSAADILLAVDADTLDTDSVGTQELRTQDEIDVTHYSATQLNIRAWRFNVSDPVGTTPIVVGQPIADFFAPGLGISTLGGTGTVGDVTVNGRLNPGTGTLPGALSTGDLELTRNSGFRAEIDGATPGNGLGSHSQVSVTGSVTIGEQVGLVTNFSSLTFVPGGKDEYVLISNDGVDPIVGEFQSVPEGRVFTDFLGSGFDATASYMGGDGNDFVISINTPEVSLDIDELTIDEDSDTATVTATLSQAIGRDTIVDLESIGTARIGDDFSIIDATTLLPTTTITIPAGLLSASAILVSLQDDIFESPDEQVLLNIDAVDQADISTTSPSASTVILDDDPIPGVTMTVDQSTIAEDGGVATFTFTLTNPSSAPINIPLVYSGLASRFVDYTPAPSVVTIAPETLATSIALSAIGDPLHETPETVIIDIVGLDLGAVMPIGSQQQTTTIIDDDPEPFITLSVDNPNILEASLVPGDDQAVVTARLSTVAGRDVIIDLDLTNSDGTDTVDFMQTPLFPATQSQIVIPAGQRESTLLITSIDDGTYENDEFVRIDVANATGATEEFTEQVIVAIIDDEPLPVVTLSPSATSIPETGGSVDFTLDVTGETELSTFVTIALSGTATRDEDFTLLETIIEIPPGTAPSMMFTIDSISDVLHETSETIVIEIIDVNGGVEATPQSSVVTITDDDAEPSVTLSIDQPLIAESGGAAVITATSSGVSGRDVIVDLDFSGTAEVNGVDYRVSESQILIPAGQTTGSVIVTSLVDSIDEVDETVVVSVASLTGASPGLVQEVTSTITDDDPEPEISLSFDTTTVDEIDGVIVVTAELSTLSGRDVTANLDFGGTALIGTDYTIPTTQLVIPAGSTTASATINTVSDLLDEFDETITVDFLNVINAVATGALQTASIIDDDALPAVRLDASPADISEVNGTATYTVSLSSPSGREVTVDFGFAGAAIRDDDFDMDAQIVIPAGQTMGTVLLTSMDDTLDEVDELVVVSIASITHGVPDFVSQAETLILDNDAEASVTLTVDNATIAEDGGEATFTAELSTVSGKDITVDVLIAGAATEVADYNHSGLSLFIPAGSSEATVVVTASDDMIDELNETVIVTIDSVTGGTFTAPQTQTTTIIDDEPTPTVSLSSDVSVFDETGGTVTLTATLSEASGLPVSMDLLLSGDALQGTDYLSSEVSLLIPAGETTATFVISSLVDSLDEENESIVVDLINITNATGTTTQSTLSLIDDDATPSILLQAANSEISENGVTTSVFVTLSDISGRDVTVNLGFSGTATEDVDYSVSDSQIVVPAGQSSAGITLTTMDDSLDELTEDIFIEVTTVTNGTEFTPQQTGIDVTDDDAPPSVTLSVDNTSLDETGSVANFTATLSAASGLDVIVDLGFTGTASPGGFDYTVDVSPLVIPAGQTSAVRTVVTENDLLDEDTETIIATIDSVTGATPGGTITAMTSITDDDDMPFLTLTSNQPTISEVGGVGVLLARLSNPSGRDVSFEFELSGGATPGLDFTSTPLVITVPAGSQEATLTLTASDDLLDEFDESIITTLRPISNVLVNTPQTFTTNIVDNDIEPGIRLQIDNGQIAEAGGMAQIDLILSSISGKDILVDLASSGLATIGDDYTLSSSLVTIPAGSDGASVILTAIGDALDEAEETAVIDIGTVTGATETGIQQVVTVIGDDDPTPTVELSVDQLTIDEAAGTAVFTATLSEISGQNVTLSLAFLGDAQGFGVDFDNLTPQLVIPAGQQTGTYTITASDDQLDEIDEAVTISITTASNADIGANNSATTTILDDDQAPNVILTSSLSAIPEAGGTSVVTATLSTVSGKDVTINLGLGGVPVDTVDYSHLGSSIVIPAGSNSGTFTLTALDDLIDELDEVVVIDIASLNGAGEAFDQQVEVTIVDDELAPSVSLLVDNSQIDEAGGIATFTTTLSEVSGLDVTVELIRSGTATLGSDYTETGTTVVIPAGSLSGEYVVSAINDLINEANEVVDVQISGVTNATVGGSSFNSTQIIDDEPLPVVSLSVDQTDLDELGGQALLTVSISELSGRDVTVNLAASGTALDNIDYALSGTSVTIPAGETEATITLSSISDDLDEVAETVSVDVTSVVNGFESTPQTVQLTIIDDDATPRISLQSSTTTIDELGNTTAVLTATLSSASGRDVFVDAVFSGTATGAGVDYSSSSTQFFIPAGSISHTISVTTVDDALDEVDETVIVNFGQAITGALPGLSTESTITVRDNDPTPLVRLLANRGVISEGGETAQVAATLSGISGRDVTIELSLTGSALAGTDYTHDPIQLTIPAGSLSTPFSLTSIDDSLDEFNETVTVSVATAIGATVDTAGSASIQIFDNDNAGIVLTETGGSTIVSELGDQDTVTVALSSQPASTVVLNLAIGDDTEGTLSASQLIFTPGNWNVPQSVFLMGVADAISDGLQTYAIIAQVDVTQSDPGYALVSNQVIVASTTDLTVTDFFVTVVGTEVQVTAGIGGRLLLSAPINSTDPLEIRGGAEANTVVVESLEGVIPALIINTGDGDDQITISDYQGVTIDGGAGFDTLIIGDSGNAIDLTTAADGALANIEAIDLDGTGTNTLSLTPEDLERQYGPTAVIGISYTPDDIVEFGDGWIPQEPFFLNGQFTHRLIRDGLELQVNNGQANTNPQNGLDTNRNGDVTPVDALVVINEIDESGAGPLNVPVFGGPVNEFYLDVNGDGNLTPIDALIVINFLNNAPNQPFAEAPPATPPVQSLAASNQPSDPLPALVEPVSALANVDAGEVSSSADHQAYVDSLDSIFSQEDEDDDEDSTWLDEVLGSGL